MRETYEKHNHNQKGDYSKRDRTCYLKKHCLIADFIKIINDTTGLFDCLSNPELEALDKRVKNVEYSFHFILVVCALACCLGISAAHTFASTFIEPDALENISFLTHENTSIVIDYQAINNAISKMDDLSWIEGIAQDICEKMHRSGRYNKYLEYYGLPVVLDATDYAFFRGFHCIHDLTATFHKGTKEETTYYFHKALVARVFFTKTISFPIGLEFIENEEVNPTKQDCENEAAIRLLKRIKKRFPHMTFIICGDALYANKTFISLCHMYKWNYLFTLKEGCQPSLCAEFSDMVRRGLTGHAKVIYNNRENGIVYWANDMGVIVNNDLPMNILCYKTQMAVTNGKKSQKSRKIQNVILRRKDIAQNMPELSKDQSKYNLDGRKLGEKARFQKEEADKREEKSDKAKEDLSKINAELLQELGDGQISGDAIKVGDTIEASFMYITNLSISTGTVGSLLVRGRLRWQIEECFLREKVGTQKIEHLKSKDPITMKLYFWMECIADSCMQIYLNHSKALKVFGTETEVYRKLRESFETKSLKDTYDTSRECHWHYENDRNVYPTVCILPDDDPEETGWQDKRESTSQKASDTDMNSARKGHSLGKDSQDSPAKVIVNGSGANASSGKCNVSNSGIGGTDGKEDAKTAKKNLPESSPASETKKEMAAENPKGRGSAGQSGKKDVNAGSPTQFSDNEAKEASTPDNHPISTQAAEESQDKESSCLPEGTAKRVMTACETNTRGESHMGGVHPDPAGTVRKTGRAETKAVSKERNQTANKGNNTGKTVAEDGYEPDEDSKIPPAPGQMSGETAAKEKIAVHRRMVLERKSPIVDVTEEKNGKTPGTTAPAGKPPAPQGDRTFSKSETPKSPTRKRPLANNVCKAS